MENRYYYVPVTSRNISHNDVSLFGMLKVVDKELYDRENERVRITYDEPKDIEYVDAYNKNTKFEYDYKGLPQNIILVQNDDGIRELSTGCLFKSSTQGYLEAFEVDGMSIVDLFVEDADYATKSEFFITSYLRKKRKVLSKTNQKSGG